jgi:hypothetical protein
MDSANIAEVDRRIEIISGSDEQRKSLHRVSHLRDLPHVVLLGEPGSGKTTVLASEAQQQGLEAVRVRDLINGAARQDATLFLDALDEYRSDGQEKDKASFLSNAIKAAGATSWWLSCRAEDWRKESDIQAIRDTAQGRPIIVAQLLPLHYWEAVEILRALERSEPETFMDRADALGAEAFTQNPLSLRLLHAAVDAKGHWPKTRFDLFESAVWRLAHEHDPNRKHDPRPAPEAIIQTADSANLMLLVSGARSLWRSNVVPPDDAGDRPAYLTAHDLGVEHSLIAATLDTALFRGEGDAFEPMHRTIAEFTAARALARAVRGSEGRAAFPLSRALALITAPDGGPPTELRGLFAWFAAHLAKLGDRAGAIRLIEKDATTVMSYGDAAVFDTECRRAIFHHLDRETPNFRSHESGSTSAAGLAGEDLAEDFAQVLRGPMDGSQRMYTVLDALTVGVPVPSLKPLLREMALDVERADWVRRRAANAWLNGHPQPAQGRRELFDALATEPVSEAREVVRLELVREALEPALTTTDVKSLISAYRDSPRSITVGRMMWLKAELQKRPRPELFDTPVKAWLRENSGADYQYEINEVLDEALAAVIRDAGGDLTAARLLGWLKNASWYGFPRPEKETQTAVREWIGEEVGREVDLLLTIKDGLPPDDRMLRTVIDYQYVTGRSPSPVVVDRLLSLAVDNSDASVKLLDIAFYCVRNSNLEIDLYWRLHDRLRDVPQMVLQFKVMRVHQLESNELNRMKRVAERKKKEAKKRVKDVAKAMVHIHDIASARRPGYLQWAAEHYFGWRQNDSQTRPGVPAVALAFNSEIADAVVAGWRHILTADYAWPSVVEIAEDEAKHRSHYYVEYAVLAALDLLIEKEEDALLMQVPLRVAISALRKDNRVRQEERRRRIMAWAIQRICRDVDQGASLLLEFWTAALDAGSTDIALLYDFSNAESAVPVVQRALRDVLRARPYMHVHALRQALSAAAKQLSLASLRDLTREALANAAVKGKSRRMWSYVDFSFDPAKFDRPNAVLPSQRTILATFNLVLQHNDLIDLLDIDQETRALHRAMIIFALGRSVSPSADYPDVRHRLKLGKEEVIRKSINMLGAMMGSAVSGLFSRLIADPSLEAWRKELMHARFQHVMLMRDFAFKHPSSEAVRNALAGKAPVNAADLRAIACEELRRLQRELRTGVDSPWRQYWDNVGKRERAATPKIENECRNHLILRLEDRMRHYGIVITQAEVRHAEETRSDIAFFSYAGNSFPVEIKRDSNAQLWSAASIQLQHYANADTADGSGLYLVFWFNHPDSHVSAPPEGLAKPASAQQLEAMLVDALSEDLRHRFEILVFDVSDPDARLKPKTKKKKVAKANTTKSKATKPKVTKPKEVKKKV